MDFINVLIFWVCICLIFVLITEYPLKKSSKKKTKTHKRKFILKNSEDKSGNVKEETSQKSSEPKPKPSTVFVADLVNPDEKIFAEQSEKEDDAEEDEHVKNFPDIGIVDEDMDVLQLEIEHLLEDILPDDFDVSNLYTVESTENVDMEMDVYNTMIPEEPWYEHEKVRSLIDDTSIFEQEAKKFEIAEKEY